MVLQRDQPLYIFGTADPDTDVTVTMKGKSKSTVVLGDGSWMLAMDPIPLGEPFTVIVKGPKNEIKLKNVLAGKV